MCWLSAFLFGHRIFITSHPPVVSSQLEYTLPLVLGIKPVTFQLLVGASASRPSCLSIGVIPTDNMRIVNASYEKIDIIQSHNIRTNS